MESFQAGVIVNARGREWVVLPESNEKVLHLRGLGAGESEKVVIFIAAEPVRPVLASFPLPDPTKSGISIAAQTLKDALLLKLRHGSGPFRSFGNIALEPRPYQLVPLMMALKLPTVRILIADDVGIGKTIEASLIVRELLDRGEINSFTVLCPPHLCEQWRTELSSKFHLDPEIVNTKTAVKLERSLPPGKSVFEVYPFTVVSLDYVKSQKRRDEFIRSAPNCMIVDEAHSCVLKSAGRHQRYELLKGLSQNAERHMILLTATPHSGDDEGFYNLLGLLKNDFLALKGMTEVDKESSDELRQELANYFVQRRRPDIVEWQDQSVFPKKESPNYDVTYNLNGKWGDFFKKIKSYARELVSQEVEGKFRQRLNWWAALALLRCASSSPAAAEAALSTRLARRGDQLTTDEWSVLEEELRSKVLDGDDESIETLDLEPGVLDEDAETLKGLVKSAQNLQGVDSDPKLAKLVEILHDILDKDFSPVVFCRYIATANYLAEQLKIIFPEYKIAAVTGSFISSEREEIVSQLGDFEKRILVATDCLSEGINLQDSFNSVIHYDLSWNPTRHEQREGRVDRFGQKSKVVRMAMIHGRNNPIDEAVHKVIIRKAEKIKKELGVLVPLPDEDLKITEKLVKQILLVSDEEQLSLFEGDEENKQLSLFMQKTGIDKAWIDTHDKLKKSKTVFAQNKLKPDEVIPEWKKILSLMGSEKDVEKFVKRAFSVLNYNLIEDKKFGYELNSAGIENRLIRDELKGIGFDKPRYIDFNYPPRPKSVFIHRTHPIVSILSNYIFEVAIEETDSKSVARSGAIISSDISEKTVVFLVRLRMKIKENVKGVERQLMAEEALLMQVGSSGKLAVVEAKDGRTILDSSATSNLSDKARIREVEEGLKTWEHLKKEVTKLAQDKSKQLLTDHRRVRDASGRVGKFEVEPILPVDLIGVFVFLPKE